jgi:hypothetical protein
MDIRFQFRRGLAATWTSSNPTLLAGEIGLETDTGKLKFGNGTTAWTSLNYVTLEGVLLLAGGTMAGELNLADNLLTRPYCKDVAEVVGAIGNTGAATKSLDLTTANVFTACVTGNVTFTFDNPPASGRCGTFTLILQNGAAYTVTWPTVKWPGGTAPTLTASGYDVLVFFTVDGGTTWRGCMVQGDSK